MNPDAYPGYDSTYFDHVMRAARSYHISDASFDFKTDQETMDALLGKANAKQDAPTPTPDEPYDNANLIREIDYSNFTEEELNQSIDYLHEILLNKRGESLLDLEPGLE